MEAIQFELTYSALKMFGKQLYSNVGSAISELVANGLDAGAKNVYISINIIDKHNAIVEILDDGCGMNQDDIRNNYIKIGHNKRKDNVENHNKYLGRKGIGKLAALYLSDCFTILTKKNEEDASAWRLDVSQIGDNDQPKLEPYVTDVSEKYVCKERWENQSQGTYIYLENVDFNRFGERAFESLESKLSNYYILDNLGTNIYLNIFNDESKRGEFKLIEKRIAYNNMVCIYAFNTDDFLEYSNSTYSVPYEDKLGNSKEYVENIEILSFSDVLDHEQISGTYKGKKYELKGWVGIHSSIDKETAEKKR